MTPDEVIKKLKAQGVTITVRTLQNWVNAGLVPKPERGRKGTGGSWADYPPETIPEALTAHLLKDMYRLKNDEIKKARRGYLEGRRFPYSRVYGWCYEAVVKGRKETSSDKERNHLLYLETLAISLREALQTAIDNELLSEDDTRVEELLRVLPEI